MRRLARSPWRGEHVSRWKMARPAVPAEPGADPVSRLDVSVLQDRLLAPILGIDDPRTSKRVDFVGGIRGTGELVRRRRPQWAAWPSHCSR